ncbi:MAG TPA: aminoglycoside phosphotransferase family protein [Nocardioides sp.]|nr:aminoglycoside phosphotransferase family protein [Nocardioides sp.]
MSSANTHDLLISESEVRKRYASWQRGEPEREWSCLTLLAEHAPGVAPVPLHRETDPDGAPVITMTRLPGAPLGSQALTPVQTQSLGRALRHVYEIPAAAVHDADIPERLYGPTTLPTLLAEWLRDAGDLSRCQDARLVRAGIDAALAWLAEPGVLPEPQLSTIGVTDRKPANILWDGRACRLVDFEDSGRSDPAYEFADQLEHLAGRLSTTFDRLALADAIGLSPNQRQRAHAYRPLWATFWMAMLLPGNGAFERNPPGTTESQAGYVLELIGGAI